MTLSARCKTFSFTLLLASAALSFAPAAQAQGIPHTTTTSKTASSTLRTSSAEGIYGTDNRRDLYQVTSPQFKLWARASVALIDADDIRPASIRKTLFRKRRPYVVRSTPLGPQGPFCLDEPFYSQMTAPFCSGALVGPDLILTAGHCVSTQEACDKIAFVFDWAIRREGQTQVKDPTGKEVFFCSKLIHSKFEASGVDFAVVQLDRKVRNRTPLKINRTGDTPVRTPLVVIGHPMGLPTKVADGAKVWDSSASSHFVADLDTYEGNSGSPVINAETGVIEGVLVRGGEDFAYDDARDCLRSYTCKSDFSTDSCQGESATKTVHAAPHIPVLRAGSH